MAWSEPTTTSNSGVAVMMSCIAVMATSGAEVSLALVDDRDRRVGGGDSVEALLERDVERDALDAVEVDDVAGVDALGTPSG